MKQIKRSRGASSEHGPEVRAREEAKTPLAERIKFVLTEARVVLPGAQALLGFQFAATLTEAFDKLAPPSRTVHLISLILVALAIIFLMSPAAYHRIVEGGEDSEGLHKFASAMVLSAMAVLAAGVCGDLFVVALKVFGNANSAATMSALTLLSFYAFWFGYMLVIRGSRAAEKIIEIDQARAA